MFDDMVTPRPSAERNEPMENIVAAKIAKECSFYEQIWQFNQ
jgi:hypothetical protein